MGHADITCHTSRGHDELLGPIISGLKKLSSREGYLYAGYPNYMGLFGRDSLISAWQLLDSYPGIARATLLELARLQGRVMDQKTGEEPGKILHEYYKERDGYYESFKSGIQWLSPGRPVYFSVDSTPLFLIVLREYYGKTGDIGLVKSLSPNTTAAVQWMLRYGIEDGFLRYEGMPDGKGLSSQSWKDGAGNILGNVKGPVAVVEVQGYLYAALNSISSLERDSGIRLLDHDISGMAQELKSRVDREFKMRNGYYCLALDGSNSRLEYITSNPGHLLFTGMLDEADATAVAKRLFEPDMLTAYGIRTHSSSEPSFDEYAYQLGSVWAHDNWMISLGLKATGRLNEYGIIRKSIIRAYTEYASIPEYFGVRRNGALMKLDDMRVKPADPQAWALGALYSMITDNICEQGRPAD